MHRGVFWISALLSGVLVFGLLVMLIEPILVFFPNQKPLTSCSLPEGVRHVEFSGERGLFTEGNGETLLVFYHGNSESACNWRFLGVNHARQFGFDTLVMEYPGYSDDPRSIQPSADRIATMIEETHIWAQARYSRIVTMGFSLGTGAASIHAGLGGVDRVALFAPYQSLFELAQSKGYPFPKFWFRNNLDSATALTHAQTPVHVTFGTRDRIIPPSRSEALIRRLDHAGVVVTYRSVPNAGHSDLFGPDALDEALRFLRGS